MCFSKEAAVFGSHGSDSGARIWVDIFPETFGHKVTLHLEGPEVIVLPIKLLDDWGANLALLIAILSLLTIVIKQCRAFDNNA